MRKQELANVLFFAVIQRCGTPSIFKVHICLLIKEVLDYLLVSRKHSQMQSCPPIVVLGIWLDALDNQSLQTLKVSTSCRTDQ
jgi:hypothetical protein